MSKRLNDNDIEVLLDASFSESESSDSSSDDETSDKSDDDDMIALPTDWAKTGRARQPFVFHQGNGVKYTVTDVDKEKPVHFFEQFFNDDIIQLLVTETNRFAKQFFDDKILTLPKLSRAHKWYDTSENEMKTFLALLILQGVDSKSRNYMYFSKRESVASPFYGKIMSGRRFDLLQRFMHFADNTLIQADTPNRKIAKIKPLIDLLVPIFMQNYLPDKNISIDESLMGWKGRLSWLQYIPSKRKRFGIKFYMLSDSATGYIWNFFIYAGGETLYNPIYNHLPITSRIVFTLVHPLLGKGYCLYTDNFYTSVTMADLLNQQQTDIVGTVRLNRKDLPKYVKETKLKKGETVSAYRNKVIVLKWKDKKDVTLLSSIHDNSMQTTTTKRGKEKQKPQLVASYNAHMGGVDLSDNLICHYTTAKNRMKKYYRKVFRHTLDMAVLNSFVCYKHLGGKMDRCNYIITLAEDMISKYATNLPIPSTSGGRPSRIVAKPSRLIGRHFPANCPPSESRQKGLRRCAECRKHNKVKQSSIWCKECEVALCVVPCFKDWHTKK